MSSATKSHKRAGLFAALFTLAVCALVAILLLANSGKPGQQLEGAGITQVYALHEGMSVKLPQEMGQTLVALLDEHGHEDYAPLSEEFQPQDGMVSLSGQNGGTVYYFDPDALILYRLNQDSYSDPHQSAPVADSLAQDADYTAWLQDKAAYLETGRAQLLFDNKLAYIGDHVAVGELLNSLNIQQVLGSYTIELNTDTEPYGLTLCLTERSPLVSYSSYEHALSDVLFALVENLKVVSFTSQVGQDTQTTSIQIFETEEEYRAVQPNETNEDEIQAQLDAYEALKHLTLDDFLVLFDKYEAQTAQMLTQLDDQTYTTQQVLYLNPDRTPNDPTLYQGSTFVIPGAANHFSATVTNALSSAQPETETFDPAQYREETSLALIQNISPELSDLDDQTLLMGSRGWRILAEDGTDTGYRFYVLPSLNQDAAAPLQSLVGHASYNDEQTLTLDWLFQVQVAA